MAAPFRHSRCRSAVLCGQRPGPRLALNLWLHFPAGSTGSAASGGKTGQPYPAEGRAGARGPRRIPRATAPPAPARLSPVRPTSVKGWRRLGSAYILRGGNQPPLLIFSFTMTPVAHRYKSNEEYVYVRGRGRGKYVCEECGIRCKKPSMLKKHIRTHTDVRPYVCKHCHFAFKTKGKTRSAGALPRPTVGSSPLGALAQSSGAWTALPGACPPPQHCLGSPGAEQPAGSRLGRGARWLPQPALLDPTRLLHQRAAPAARWRSCTRFQVWTFSPHPLLLHVSLALDPLSWGAPASTLVTTTLAFGNPFHSEPLSTLAWSLLMAELAPASTRLTTQTMFLPTHPAPLQLSAPACSPPSLGRQPAPAGPSRTPQHALHRPWQASEKGRRVPLQLPGPSCEQGGPSP